jgi:hypothetical protein
MLSGRSRNVLISLRELNWFSSVGSAVDEDVVTPKSWSAAISHSASDFWDDFVLDRRNEFTRRLQKLSPSRDDEWNECAREIKLELESLIFGITQSVTENRNMAKKLFSVVRWDILHFVLEVEYSDVLPSAFFTEQAKWYLRGHFPCGWEGGEYPQGRRIVY